MDLDNTDRYQVNVLSDFIFLLRPLTNASDDDDGGWVEGCVFEFKALETTMTLRYVSTAMKARDKDSRLMQT
jgi:hypothetical protein